MNLEANGTPIYSGLCCQASLGVAYDLGGGRKGLRQEGEADGGDPRAAQVYICQCGAASAPVHGLIFLLRLLRLRS